MPLHLLGKKSWNVYNPANIARVRADEAAARAAEEAEERRMQERDAARRMAILRGEVPPPLEEDEPEEKKSRGNDRDRYDTRPAKRQRRRHGEDDTDFEMRVARERAEAIRAAPGGGVVASAPSGSIVDRSGHIDLFLGDGGRGSSNAEKNPDAERERREAEAEMTGGMRFADAAGKGRSGSAAPWYTKGAPIGTAGGDGDQRWPSEPTVDFEATTTDVWGRDDPGRKVRAAARVTADDPLAAMKTGARQAREVNQERRREVEERERELREMRRGDRRREKRTRRSRREEEDGGGDGNDGGISGSAGRSHRRHHSPGRRHRDKEKGDDEDKRARQRWRPSRPRSRSRKRSEPEQTT